MDDEELLRNLIDAVDEVSHLTHRLEAVASRLDRLVEATGTRWAPELFDKIDQQETAALAR